MTDIPPHVAWPVHLFRLYGLTQKADINNIVPILSLFAVNAFMHEGIQ